MSVYWLMDKYGHRAELRSHYKAAQLRYSFRRISRFCSLIDKIVRKMFKCPVDAIHFFCCIIIFLEYFLGAMLLYGLVTYSLIHSIIYSLIYSLIRPLIQPLSLSLSLSLSQSLSQSFSQSLIKQLFLCYLVDFFSFSFIFI